MNAAASCSRSRVRNRRTCPRYDDPEIVVRLRKSHHAGIIVSSRDSERIIALLRGYTERFYVDFHASAPPPERPTE